MSGDVCLYFYVSNIACAGWALSRESSKPLLVLEILRGSAFSSLIDYSVSLFSSRALALGPDPLYPGDFDSSERVKDAFDLIEALDAFECLDPRPLNYSAP